MVEFFNFYYFLYIVIAAGLFVILYIILRKASARTRKTTIFLLLLFNFALHFIKLAFEPYCSGLPATVRKSTFENICAVSTLIFPWIFIGKNKYFKDYMFYIGVLSGLAALGVPTEALGKSAFSFDTIRFYCCHIVLVITPLLMVCFGLHKLNYHRVFAVPAMFLAVLSLILVNEVILLAAGFVEGDLSTLLDPGIRNSSFIFGPSPGFEQAAKIILVFVPKLFTVQPLTGEPMFWPVIWLVFPAFVYLPFVAFLMSLPSEHAHVKKEIGSAFKRIKARFTK